MAGGLREGGNTQPCPASTLGSGIRHPTVLSKLLFAKGLICAHIKGLGEPWSSRNGCGGKGRAGSTSRNRCGGAQGPAVLSMMVQGPRLPSLCCRREAGAAFPPVPSQSTGSNQPEEAEQHFLPFTPAPLEALTTWAGPVGTAASGWWGEGDPAHLLGHPPPRIPLGPRHSWSGAPFTYIRTCWTHTGTTQNGGAQPMSLSTQSTG